MNKFQEEKQGSLNWHGLEKELYEKKKKTMREDFGNITKNIRGHAMKLEIY